MKQLKYTTKDFMATADQDAQLQDDDPIHEYKRTGDATVFDRPRTVSLAVQAQKHMTKLAEAKAQGIKPGSPAWHML
jgi:hypothetical protein